MIVALHLLVGCCAVLAGFTAMGCRKGGRLHKLAGQIFVGTMLLLCLSGFYLSYARDLQFTWLLSALSLYLVITGWLAIKQPSGTLGYWEKQGLVFIAVFTLVCFAIALLGTQLQWTYPASEPAYGAYAFIGGFSCLFLGGDIALIRAKVPNAGIRVKRHLTRMGSSMLIATTIFFLGNNHVLPAVLRNDYVLIAPIITVAVFMLVYRLRLQWATGTPPHSRHYSRY